MSTRKYTKFIIYIMSTNEHIRIHMYMSEL
jgi:hypothetical protein